MQSYLTFIIYLLFCILNLWYQWNVGAIPGEFSSSKSISKSLSHLKKGDSEELLERLLSKSSGDVGKTSVTSLNIWNSSTLHDSTLDGLQTNEV